MNSDDIIRMAREVGFETDEAGVWITDGYWTSQLERFASLVAAAVMLKMLMAGNDEWLEEARKAEREACAKVCEQWGKDIRVETWDMAGADCAAAIRARGRQ